MKIALIRNLKQLKKYCVNLEIGIKSPAPEILPFIVLANENGNRLTPKIVVEDLLFDMPEQAGINVINSLKFYQILDDRGNLTEYSLKILEEFRATKQECIFKFESGVFDFHAADDPLLQDKMIDMARTLPEKKKTRIKIVQKSCPDFIKQQGNKILTVFWNEHKNNPVEKNGMKNEVLIKDIPNFLTEETPTIDLEITIILDEDGVRSMEINGTYSLKLPVPEDIDFNTVWKDLLGSEYNNWQIIAKERKLLVDYPRLTAQEKLNFRKHVEFKSPAITKYGAFNTTVVRDVPIYPKSIDDAITWWYFILRDKLRGDYVDAKRYTDLSKSIARMFPTFNLELPSLNHVLELLKSEIIDEIKQKTIRGTTVPREYWHLQAPVDLV